MMKKLFSIIASTAIAIFALSSCTEYSVDTPVAWGFATSEDGPIVNSLEQLLPDHIAILQAFDNTFYAAGGSQVGLHETTLRAQSSKKQAEKHAKELAEKANSQVKDKQVFEGYYLVVKVGWGEYYITEKSKTVWSRQ